MMTKRISALLILSLLAFRSLSHAGYFSDGDLIEGVSTIATSGGSTTLTKSSARNIILTGTSTHTLALPDATGIKVGKPYVVHNLSSGTVTVKDNAANTLAAMLSGEYGKYTGRSTGSVAGTWDIQRPAASIGGTADMAAKFDSSGVLVSDSNISATELGYLDGVTSSLCGINQTCVETGKTFTSPVLTGAVSGGVLYTNGSSTISTHSGLTYNGSGALTTTTVVAALTGTASGNLQATANQYGVLLSGAGNTASVLAPDASTTKVLTSGGTGANPSWQAQTSAPQQSYEISNVGISASVAANALTIALKQSDGSTNCSTGAAACLIGFRNGSSTVGGYTQRSTTGALSVVVSSGSTLGHVSATSEYIYVYAIDNAGTVELAVSTSKIADEGSVITTTAEGGAGAADARATLYSTSARTNVAIRLIGRIKSTQATAGTWATAPSEVSITPFSRGVVFSDGQSERIERATLTLSSSCVITYQSSAWLSTCARTAQGQYTFTINTGMFSAPPSCNITMGDSNLMMRVRSVTTTLATFWLPDPASAMTLTDGNGPFGVICMGPR